MHVDVGLQKKSQDCYQFIDFKKVKFKQDCHLYAPDDQREPPLVSRSRFWHQFDPVTRGGGTCTFGIAGEGRSRNPQISFEVFWRQGVALASVIILLWIYNSN